MAGRRSFVPQTLVWLYSALLLVGVLLQTGQAQAYPWMIRHGYTACALCHVDPMGGGQLSLYGRHVGIDVLPTNWSGEGGADVSGKSTASATNFESFDEPPSGGAGDEPGADDPASGAKKADKTKADPKKAGAAKPGADGKGSAAPGAAPAKPAAGAPPKPEGPIEASPGTGFLWGLIDMPEEFLLSGSLREGMVVRGGTEMNFPKDNTKFYLMQADLYGSLRIGIFRAGASAGVLKAAPGAPEGPPAFVTPWYDKDQVNMVSRTHWLGVSLADDKVMVRAGRLNLPFGLRIPDHYTWVRSKTVTDTDSQQQHGVAVYFDAGQVHGEVMGIAGNYQINPDKFRERGYSAYVEWAPNPTIAVGVSSLLTHADSDPVFLNGKDALRHAHGLTGRYVPIKPLVLQAEADLLLHSDRSVGYTGLLQADFEFIQGVHVIGAGELADTGVPDGVNGAPSPAARPEYGKPAAGGWIGADWFFFRQMEARVDVITRTSDPFILLAQLHCYL